MNASGTNLTELAETNLVLAARRVLADRDRFALSDEAAAKWDTLDARRYRDLPGLRKLMDRPSPFAE